MAGEFKEIRIVLDQDTYERLRKIKGDKSWKEFLIELTERATSDSYFQKQRLTQIVNQMTAILKEELKEDDRFELVELTRVLLVNIINENYEAAVRVVRRIENKLTSKKGEEEEHSVEDIFNAKPAVDENE
mgnify:CR=1 FL=1